MLDAAAVKQFLEFYWKRVEQVELSTGILVAQQQQVNIRKKWSLGGIRVA